jgi:(S)-2-hydroxyglutarate dehydrogenase
MPDQTFDIVIIGGGIVGLSSALHATRTMPHLRLLLVEKEDTVARHQSGHNSGVIHSGIYYKPGSLKAKFCVEGAAAMVEFCREHNLPHKICGKVIVATTQDEIPRLKGLLERGQANGLAGLRLLQKEELREVEPHCSALLGVLVPSTGIADYAAVSRKYAEIIAAQGGTVSTGTEVKRVTPSGSEMMLETTRGTFAAKYVINCAGLHSDRVSRMAGQKPEVQIIPFRGEYYDLVPERTHLVRTLIYPVPDPKFPFLGVHFTQRIQGGVDAGPNAVLAFKREGYKRTDFNLRDLAGTLTYSGFWHMARKYWRDGAAEYYRSLSKAAFVRALQQLVPEIVSSDLVTDGSGVRAQAVRPDGSMVDDFQFVQADRMLHVWNVPSPAATASLPIGKHIVEMARKGMEGAAVALSS